MLRPWWVNHYLNSPMCVQIYTSRWDDAYEQEECNDDYSKSLEYASIRILMNYFSDEIMTKWSWINQRNDPKIVKRAIGSQYNKVDPRVAAVIVFVYKTRKIYSKVYQGKSNTLT